jgi:hypothetical protein
MPDNVAITAGSGTSIITDEVVGVGHIQVFKQAISADGSGTLIPADATNGMDVDVTRVIPGTGATELGKAEDAPHTSGDVGVMALGIRNDSGSALAGTTGDYIPFSMTSNGAARVWVEGLPVTDDATAGSGGVGIAMMAVRRDAPSITEVSADGDYVVATADNSGALRMVPQPAHVRLSQTPTIATSGYTAGDQVGGLLTFTSAALASGRSGQVINAVLTSRTSTALNNLELWLFQASPTFASTDNAAFDLTDANLEAAQLCGVIDFTAGDYRTTASGAICTGEISGGPVSVPFVTSGSANLFGVLVIRGTIAAQYAGTTDIIVALTIQQY